MILGVMSDTHGNRALMHRVADQMMRDARAECILHLGDDYTDGEELAMAGYPVEFVPGLWCAAYRSPRAPNMRVLEFAGVRVALAHDMRDIHGPARAAQVVLVGHTHEARIVCREGVLYVNPGHLKASKHRGEYPSYAVVDIRPGEVTAAIHERDGSVRESATFSRSQLMAEAG